MAKTSDAGSAAGPDPFEEFQIGDQVKHPKWGLGTILFRSGAGDGAKAIVVFQDEGQKKLALKYAKLKKTLDAKPAIVEPEPVVAKDTPVEDEATEAGEDDLEEEVEIEDDEEVLPEDIEEEIPLGDDEEEEFNDFDNKDEDEG